MPLIYGTRILKYSFILSLQIPIKSKLTNTSFHSLALSLSLSPDTTEPLGQYFCKSNTKLSQTPTNKRLADPELFLKQQHTMNKAKTIAARLQTLPCSDCLML